MDTLQGINATVTTAANKVLKNGAAMGILKVFLILYASKIAVTPKLAGIFDNNVVKVIMVTVMFMVAHIDFQLAIIIALVYVFGMAWIGSVEGFANYPDVFATDLLGNPTVKNTQQILVAATDSTIKCNDVKLSDLTALFENTATGQTTLTPQMQQLIGYFPRDSSPTERLLITTRALGLPYNIEANDTNAPLMATYLLAGGFQVTKACKQ